MPIFVVPEDNNDIINNENSFSGISSPGSNANYVGQTLGPGGMGMSAYMDRPETQEGWTGYDYSPGYDTNTYNLGQTYGPAGMGMSAYMDRPGPMEEEMAAPPDNIGYDRMGPGPWNDFGLEDPWSGPGPWNDFGLEDPWSGPGPWNDFGLDHNMLYPDISIEFGDPDLLGMTGEVDMTQAASADAIDKLKAQGIPDETIIQIFGKDAFDIWNESNFPIGYSTETSNLENFDYYHYRRNGYTHDETMQILEEQGLV